MKILVSIYAGNDTHDNLTHVEERFSSIEENQVRLLEAIRSCIELNMFILYGPYIIDPKLIKYIHFMEIKE